jgi:hypothetical protein
MWGLPLCCYFVSFWLIYLPYPFFFLLFICGKTTFLCRDKDHALTYQRLTVFEMSFAYSGFLDTRLFLGPSLFSIPLVFRYRVTSRSRFYQTWFLTFRIVVYFVESCLTMWSRGLHHLVSNPLELKQNSSCSFKYSPNNINGSSLIYLLLVNSNGQNHLNQIFLDPLNFKSYKRPNWYL